MCKNYSSESIDLVGLEAFLKAQGGSIVVGAQNVVLQKHSRPVSLDVWLRNSSRHKDIRQVTQDVLDCLQRCGPFCVKPVVSPYTGRNVLGLTLRS